MAAEHACGLAPGARSEEARSQKPSVSTAHNVTRSSNLDQMLVKYAYCFMYLHRNADLKDCIFIKYSNSLHLVV